MEQSQIHKSGFAPEAIQNTGKTVPIDTAIRRKISGYYSSKQPFTNGLTIRNWLAGQDFNTQYEFKSLKCIYLESRIWEELQLDVLIANYLYYVKLHAKSTMSGDYKACNKSASEIERMNKLISKFENSNATYQIIDGILGSNCINAIMWIVPVCKEKHYKVEVIKRMLMAFSANKKLGILALDAAMLLKTL